VNACQELAELVVARPLGLLEDGDEGRAAAVDAHLEGCEPCQRLAAAAKQCGEELALPAAPLPASGWSELAAKIDSDRKRSGLRVAVGCAYCHDALAREEAAYCAACLAPHHRDCFSEHGQCCAPGCGETRYVESQIAGPRRPKVERRPRRFKVLGGLAALLLLGGAAAAIVPELPHVRSARSRAWTPRAELFELEASKARLSDVVAEIVRFSGHAVVVGARPDDPRLTFTIHDSTWHEAVEEVARLADETIDQRGEALVLTYVSHITFKRTDADVREVIRDLAALGQKNVIIAPEVKGTVTLDLKQVHWLKALHAVVKTAGDYEIVEESEDQLRVVPRSAIKLQKLTEVIPLQFLHGQRAADLKRVLDLAIAQGNEGFAGLVVDLDAATDTLVVTGPRPSIDALHKLVERRDVSELPLPQPGR
jgi:hypothetical protein